MDDLSNDFLQKFGEVFHPHAMEQMARVKADNVRFVHYTSADTGLKILDSEKMLLRNSVLMNDFSEVSHGLDCLQFAYNERFSDRIKAVLRQVQNDLPDIFEANFNNLESDLRVETYLLSISEHNGESAPEEDHYGRLSMWRAYARKDGVAFVLANTPFVAESNALNAYTYPVSYDTRETFCAKLERVVLGLEENIDFVKSLGGEGLHHALEGAFRLACQSTKHPAFREEREWRVIYSPTLLEKQGLMTKQQNERLKSEIVSLGGVPQKVYSLPFRDYPDEGFLGATIPSIFDRVLIGPTSDPYPIWQAYTSKLEEKGVQDAPNKVWTTHVPLRT